MAAKLNFGLDHIVHHFLTTGVMSTYGYSSHPGLTLIIDPKDFASGGLALDQYEWRPAVETDQVTRHDVL